MDTRRISTALHWQMKLIADYEEKHQAEYESGDSEQLDQRSNNANGQSH